MGERNHCDPEALTVQRGIVSSERNHRAASADEAPEELFGILMSPKNGSCPTISYRVYLNEDLNLMLIHALIRVAFHHVMQGVLNSTTFSQTRVCNRNIVNRHLRLKTGRLIDNYPLLVSPLVPDPPSFFRSFSHKILSLSD